MNFGKFHFGSIEIDGVAYQRDVVIDRGKIRKRTYAENGCKARR